MSGLMQLRPWLEVSVLALMHVQLNWHRVCSPVVFVKLV